LYDSSGRFFGVVGADLSFNQVQIFLNSTAMRVKPHMRHTVLDLDGRVIASAGGLALAEWLDGNIGTFQVGQYGAGQFQRVGTILCWPHPYWWRDCQSMTKSNHLWQFLAIFIAVCVAGYYFTLVFSFCFLAHFFEILSPNVKSFKKKFEIIWEI
jgi:hypothetical protein